MSGPFRFNQETAKSPLDRSSSPFTAGQPVNFKTNVNRMKTKKWVQAKKNAYDGDDWGDYDEYDEYGVNQETPPEPEPQPPSSQRYYAQRMETPTRSFTDPAQQAPLPKARRNSFEHGEEQRAFSSSIPQPQQGYGQQHGEPQRQASGAESDLGHDPQQRRDFSPSAMPPPLQTRISPNPAEITAPPTNTQFPPRKSSVGQVESPMATSPRSPTSVHSDKPLPFIRPADIYKRVEEERVRERASLDSSRPSLDSLSSRPRDDPSSPQVEARRSLQPLETVAERKSEYLPDFPPSQPSQQAQSAQPEGVSAFDNDFWSSGPQLHPPASNAPTMSPPDDQGFRSVVDQAFTRSDDQRSIPPTPISKDSSSDMTRTNTGSTTGISPIMSRVPSSATSALKNRNQAGVDGSTPVIAEEPSETAPPVSQPTSAIIPEATHHVPRKPSPGHSRNLSSTSLPHSGLATPTRGESPARSPVVAPQKDLPEPKAAQLAIDTMQGGLSGPSPAYAAREADIADAAKSSPVRAAPGLGAAEKLSQNTFLESHNTQSPIEDVVPRDRSESPSKGRVQALAGKFGETSHSRRGSTQSNMSRNSVQSWERSQDNSRAASPTKASPTKPGSPVKEFRPHLPGQWESYATTAITPSDQGEGEKGLGFENGSLSAPLDGVDLTPTTSKQPVAEIESPDTSDPVAALKNAGAAMAQSIRSTVGLNDTTSDPQQGQNNFKSHGDVYMPRPLQLDRTASSISSIPPTPPAKDTPESEYPPPPPLKDEAPESLTRQERPATKAQLSTDPSADDQESDRLRKEIVASLSPVRTQALPVVESDRKSHQPAGSGDNRVSSILPAEYDSYWADGDHVTSQPSQDLDRSAPVLSAAEPIASTTQHNEPAQSSLLNRFSWEANTPSGQVQSGPIAESTKEVKDGTVSSPPIERAAEEERQQWSESLPEPYFGPGHVVTVTKPDPTTDSGLEARSLTPPLGSAPSLASPTREQTRSPGLHVVNTEVNPEAVDLPPRFSAEHSQAAPPSQNDSVAPQQAKEAEIVTSAPVSPIEVSKPPVAHESSAISPTTDKPLGAREIATITSTQERIATYNKTRDHWAKTDHGLESWLSSALDANPDLTTQASPLQRPSSGTVRHKHTASLSILGKLGGSNTHQQTHSTEYNTAGAQVPVSSNSPTTAAPSSSGFGGRVAGQQLKGKDLLHTAGVLSGKGMTSAKGLFAKGKSRFGRDKASAHSRTDSMPSSREASEEPEYIAPVSRASTAMTTTPEKSLVRSATAADSPNDEKKKRRFSLSSPFHRSSRSRSRPNSIILPSNSSSLFGSGTPRGTPPRELSRILGDESSRPHSYHAPDSWTFAPGLCPPASNSQFDTTPPRNTSQPQSRLGILPSPAKSAFSSQEHDIEQDIPPVPPLPETMGDVQQQYRTSQDDAAHKMLQSVIRNSTPVSSIDVGKLVESVECDEANTKGGAVSSVKARPSDLEGAMSIPEDTLNLERQHEPMSDNPTQIDESDHQLVQSSLKSMPGASPPAAQSLDRTDVDEDTIEALTSLNQCHHDEDGNNGLPQLRRSPSPVAAGSLPQLQHLPSNGDEHRTLQVNENLSPAVVATTSPNATVHAEKSSPVMSSIKISDDNDDDDDDDDDDKPPQLNHDPIPAATGPQLQDLLPAIAFIDSSQLDVSDDEDDGPPHASRTSMLQAPNTGLLTGDVSPLLKPVELSIDHVRDEDYAEHFPEDGTSVTDASHQHRGDQDTLDFENFAANQGNKRPLSELDFVESGVKTPTFPQGKSDEPVNQPQDKKLAVDPSDGNLCENVESTVKRPSFETELIGGDVSPISTASHGVEDEDATPKAEVPRSARWFAKDHHLQFPKVRAQGAESFTENPTVITSLNLPEQKDVVSNSFHPSPRQIGEIAVEGQLPEATRDSSLSPDHTLPPQLHVANTEADTLTHRVSATPFQVVHAVEYAASSSSLTSWDHDSIAANSHYESSQPDEMKDESDLVTPVAQVPRITQHGPQADKAEEPYDKTSSMAMQNGYFRGQTNFPEPIHQSQQLHTSKSDMTVPERSKSLLSQISAMVSEGGNPISPASSVAGRSTPSTIRRMQRDSSTKNPLTPAQIPEEPTTAWSDHTPTAKDDDFDLYADHNGIVKDIRDKSGQPLRVASPQTSDSAQHSHAMKSTAAPAGAVPTPKDEDRPRYSTERPMSFISGPPDSDGKPQDQINQFAPPSDTQVPPVPEQYRKPPQQAGALPVDTSYSGDPSISLAQPQHQGPPLQQSSQESVAASNKVQNTSHVEQNAAAHGQVISNPSQESTPPPRVAEGSSVNQQVPQNGQVLYHGLKGRPVYETTPPPSVPQGTPVQGQPLAPDHDPRVQGQPLGPPLGPPRNQYEYHQQMMQLQSKAPQFRSAENQVPPTFVHQPSTQVPKPQEKHSSKPRLSSVFKSLGGKSHAAQPPSAPSTAMHSSLKPLPADPHRNGSFHSAVSSLSLSHEPSAGRHGEQLGSYPTANRPPSMGAESHFSQISQGSTRVQPTDSRIDLRKPASPAPFQGIPPQHPPLAASVPNGQPQPHRAPTSGVVETGKKKRFSTLGGLFGRSATASDGPPTKNKLSKEDKKALKAQRNSTAPPMQAPAQQWPPQQQQFRPQQPGMVYPPGHNPPQSMQAMRPMGPQYASPQTMSPMSPQVLQGTQGMPSQRVFQQYPGPQQGPPPLQPMVGNRPEQGSAFLRTKQLAEEHQAQQKLARLSLQGSHLGPQASSTSFDQLPPQLRQPSWDAPPGGYYKPDTKPPIADQGSYAASQAARQQVLQQRQESIREEGAYAASQAERLQLQQRQQSMHEQAPYSTSHNERLAAQQRQRPGSEQGAYAGSQAERLQAPPLRQQLAQEQGAYRAPHTEQQQILLQQQGMTDQMAYEASLAQRQQAERQQAERQQIERQHVERQHVERQHVERQHVERQQAERQLLERQQAERQRQRPVPGHGGYGISHDERLHIQQQHQFHPQHQSSNAQPPLNHRSVSGPPPHHALHTHPTVPQRHVSSPLTEPQYEAPPIPAAYSHVSGAFISPRDQQQQPLFSPANESVARPSIDQYGRQFSDPRMPSISPQVSAQSQMPPNNRTHSDASTASVVSPISNSPDIPTASPPPGQRPQKPRMSSISEVRQQERPWHMNFPEGATEQEIVRARQRQYMEAQFTAQQQLHAERSAQSPSPRAPSHEQTPVHDAAPLPQAPMHGGGFKELLPRSSPQPFTVSQPAQPSQEEPQRVADSPHSQPAHIHPDQAPPPAALPLPMSPDSSDPRSPVNPLAGTLPPPPPPPKVPHSPMRPMFPPSNSPPKEEQQQQHIAPTLQQYETPPPPGQQYSPPPPSHEPQYEQSVPDEPPPSYDGPGVPNDGMDKSRSERRPRPPNITTDTEYAGRGRQQDPRQRQPSLGILQHPQPASMAASPQRSSADMGAESLRRQLLQQEEQARMERIQRAQIQRAESDRERHERDMARARARELERSASGGGRVGSLRSVAGSRNGGTPGWERRGSTTRPVFELPAVEDDEPSMKATSYPGQEWVPPMWTDD